MPVQNKRFALMASVTALGNRRGEVMIYSVISSVISDWAWGDSDPVVTSNRFDKALKDLGDVDEITVRINSPGGAVSEAVAIRTQLIKHPARKIIDIEGSCASAATLIACMPGAKVRMAKGSDYMIHRCTWGARGHADTMLAAYNSMMNPKHGITRKALWKPDLWTRSSRQQIMRSPSPLVLLMRKSLI